MAARISAHFADLSDQEIWILRFGHQHRCRVCGQEQCGLYRSACPTKCPLDEQSMLTCLLSKDVSAQVCAIYCREGEATNEKATYDDAAHNGSGTVATRRIQSGSGDSSACLVSSEHIQRGSGQSGTGSTD